MSVYKMLKPLLFSLEPEQAHDLVKCLGKLAQITCFPLNFLRYVFRVDYSELKLKALGIEFDNPVGLSAGFDKNAELTQFIHALGFGFMEVGSISALPSLGNPKPRLFRLIKDEALVNRMGLNNAGVQEVVLRFGSSHHLFPIGFNIAKTHSSEIFGENAIEDLTKCYALSASCANFIVLNVSCPNTKEGKTFEEPESLSLLLDSIRAKKKELDCKKPLLVKFSLDLETEKLADLAMVCEEADIDGYVLTNTTTSRKGLLTSPYEIAQIGNGGLSGRPIFEKALAMVRHVYKLTKGRKIIIGCGGIDSAESAYQFIKAGASLIELYTGFIYQGPFLVKNINIGLLKYLAQDGFTNISQAIGSEV